eukprot:scaffold3256_cov114-Isochrysis_galbana.AAC.5
MEHPPADARAAPSASEPNDVVMDIASSPKRPRDPTQDNKVSQRATHFDPALLEIQVSTTECLPTQPHTSASFRRGKRPTAHRARLPRGRPKAWHIGTSLFT